MPVCLRRLGKGLGVAGCAGRQALCCLPVLTQASLPVTWAAEGSSSPDPPPPSRAPGGWAWAAPAHPLGLALLSLGHRALLQRLRTAFRSSDLPIQMSRISGLQAGPGGARTGVPWVGTPGPCIPFSWCRLSATCAGFLTLNSFLKTNLLGLCGSSLPLQCSVPLWLQGPGMRGHGGAGRGWSRGRAKRDEGAPNRGPSYAGN